MANFFNWWVKYKVVDRKKKVGHGCNDIDEGFDLGKQKKHEKVFALSDVPNFAKIYAKRKEKVFIS